MRREPEQTSLDIGTTTVTVGRKPDEISPPARFDRPRSWREVEEMLPERVKLVEGEIPSTPGELGEIPPSVSGLVLVRGLVGWWRATSFTRRKSTRHFSLSIGSPMEVTDLKAIAIFRTPEPDRVWSAIQDGSWEDRRSTDHWYGR